MAYQFEHDESIPKAVRRILREQSRRAVSELRHGHPDIHTGVHSARKSFKRSRSLLRLMRDDLGANLFREENRRFRDASRLLSEVRDAEAMIEAFDQLAERFPEMGESGEIRELRDKLVERREHIASHEQQLEKRAERVSGDLRKTLERIDHWPLTEKEFDVIASGFERCYRRGRKAFRKACSKESDEQFHEWRKRIKDYWYISRLLQPSWPEYLEPRVAELKTLEDLLGQDHDLTELQRVRDESYMA